ncbi:chromosome transmission fidelity protein 18 [Marchantia polymorpha subsp. ruderalis]|uniref:AAA+ ATPase domain-containing protein n=1 Tax=Marchantia polymorpha TaxID=3197 RepID=A0A2R6W9W6_MARPO|nr:hypothetical protein MARPO_0122s0062 [Marchantia polymorpha]BBN02524.1 hypothetical protein Mp_2g16010 [Marchantia polymorpha subsp. ruderalis]|eukprot:PTQ30645.1 hypothetical protein MARPO_0122s0062 [Marchantia polymorpha]
MEEPDFDELTWMAHQGMEDEAEFGFEPEPDDFFQDDPREARNMSDSEVVCRKRSSSENSVKSSAKDISPKEKRHRALFKEDVPSSEPVHSLPLPASVSAVKEKENIVNNRTPEYDSTWSKKCGVFRMANSIDGDYITITAPSGIRVYAQRKQSPDANTRSSYKLHSSYVSETKGLLLQSIEEMIEAAHQCRLQKMFSEDPMPADRKEGPEVQAEKVHEKLWVEKYAPKSFTELLSDEQTNREVLRWLKHWDFGVFGQSDNVPTSKDVLAALRKKSFSRDGRNFQRNFKKSHFESKKVSTDDAVVNSTNPNSVKSSFSKVYGLKSATEDTNQKVLLLCGPPGLGKTTLAHVVANHCGYRVVEINASDDRVASTLQRKILDAVQMKSVTGDNRPNCLIIDEIDGAIGGNEGRSALRHLIEIVSRKKKVTGEKSTEDGAAGKPVKKMKASSESLARPIICICNDLYAPALRPLRQVARVHAFSKPSTSRIVTRLKYICEEEGYRTSVRALSTLAEHTECDIRACLNTLQFLKRKGKHLASLDDESLRIGFKDMTTNILEIWSEVFHLRKDAPSRLLMQQGRTAGCGGGQELLHFTRLYDLLGNHGDHELAVEGLHENLLHIRYQDSSFSKTTECLRSICDSDIRSKRVISKQQFFLNAYQPAAPITIRHLVAGPTRPQLQWPKAFQRYRTDLAMKMEILNSWINGMAPAISRNISSSLLSIELMTPLLAILSPPLRPVAAQLYSAAEQESMKQLVDTMIQYGLTYKEVEANNLTARDMESKNQGQVDIQLDPPINRMINFEGYKVPHRQLSATLRRLLGQQVEQEKLRREAIGVVKSCQTMNLGTSSQMLKEHGKTTSLNRHEAIEPDHKLHQVASDNQKVKVTDEDHPEVAVPLVEAGEAETSSLKVTNPPKVTNHMSFFDRIRKGGQSAHQNQAQTSATSQRDLRPLLYKYHEGFTNAIRRPLLIRELL